MNTILTDRACWRATLHSWRAWCHQNGWYTVLLVVLGIGLIEPLSCMLHCQIWLHTDRPNSLQHAHHLAPGSAALTTQRTNGSSDLHQPLLSAADPCRTHGTQSVPSHAPDQGEATALHEHHGTVGVLMLLAIVLLVERAAAGPSPGPALWAIAPPLRPPIPIRLFL